MEDMRNLHKIENLGKTYILLEKPRQYLILQEFLARSNHLLSFDTMRIA
jgi:hypothetical protein